MTHGDYEYDYNDPETRPTKRPRQGDDGHRPFIPMSGASGVHSEGDGGVEGTAKKGRKRPLSCGECRRLVSYFSMLSCGSFLLTLSLQTEAQGMSDISQTRSVLTLFQCDRVFPCQSCCKRGCAEICPEGALTGGKGSRYDTPPVLRSSATYAYTLFIDSYLPTPSSSMRKSRS